MQDAAAARPDSDEAALLDAARGAGAARAPCPRGPHRPSASCAVCGGTGWAPAAAGIAHAAPAPPGFIEPFIECLDAWRSFGLLPAPGGVLEQSAWWRGATAVYADETHSLEARLAEVAAARAARAARARSAGRKK